jgi:glucuronokinase
VGLAGSSAIIVATLHCLMDFYGVELPKMIQPSFVLDVENNELGITAGLQDRVIQVYEGLVYMNFSKDQEKELNGYKHYFYEPLDPSLLPNLYLAYDAEAGEPTEIFHNNIRQRYDSGDPVVHQAMITFADLAFQARIALGKRDYAKLAQLMNTNFDTRKTIYQLPKRQVQMVDTARSVGASAKFAGSGGAIVGTFRDENMFRELQTALNKIHCEVIIPKCVE